MFYRRYGMPAVAEINRMQREMERVFGAALPRHFRSATDYPALNVWTNDERALVTAELPGLEARDDLERQPRSRSAARKCPFPPPRARLWRIHPQHRAALPGEG
jgi:hypothetical protein